MTYRINDAREDSAPIALRRSNGEGHFDECMELWPNGVPIRPQNGRMEFYGKPEGRDFRLC